MGMVKVIGYSEVSNYACLKVTDRRGAEFYCYDFHCEFKESDLDEGKLYYILIGHYIIDPHLYRTPLFGSYDPYEVLKECDRLKNLIEVFYDRSEKPQKGEE